MGTLIQLGIYLALAGAAWAAVHSFLGGYEAKGAAAQLKADKPIIEACTTDKETAVKANVSLQVDLKRLAGEREMQNAAIDGLAKDAAAREKAKDAALADARGRLALYESDNTSLNKALQLARVKSKVTCEQTLAAVDGNLRSIARQRVRDHGPATDGSSGGANPATDKSPGADTLRIN